MRIGIRFVAAAACMTLLAVLVGCGGGGGGSNLPDPLIRFVNGSPDSNPQDFFINTDEKASALAYLSTSADIQTKPGDRDLAVEDSTDQTNLDAIAFNFALDKKYVSMTLGLQTFGTETEKRLRLQAFEYDKNAPNGTRARLLIVHGYIRQSGSQTPAVDFQGGTVGTYDPNNPQFKVTDIPFAGAPRELEVDSGVPLIFQARRATTENVVASDASTTFDDGGIYIALISGVEGAVGASAPKVTYIKLN